MLDKYRGNPLFDPIAEGLVSNAEVHAVATRAQLIAAFKLTAEQHEENAQQHSSLDLLLTGSSHVWTVSTVVAQRLHEHVSALEASDMESERLFRRTLASLALLQRVPGPLKPLDPGEFEPQEIEEEPEEPLSLRTHDVVWEILGDVICPLEALHNNLEAVKAITRLERPEKARTPAVREFARAEAA